jgi:hypothetical protein
VRHTTGRGEKWLATVAEAAALPLQQVRLAVDFYAAFPEEIDRRIEADEQLAERMRETIQRREQLLAS